VSAVVRLLFVICTCAVAQAFASGPASVEPEQSASQQSAPATADAAKQQSTSAPANNGVTNATATSTATEKTSTTQSPSSTVVVNKVVLVDKTLTDAQVKELLAKGYKPQARGSEVFYCRREPILGSKFEHKVCKSAEQIALAEKDSKEMTERIQRTGSVGGNGQ